MTSEKDKILRKIAGKLGDTADSVGGEGLLSAVRAQLENMNIPEKAKTVKPVDTSGVHKGTLRVKKEITDGDGGVVKD